MLCSKHRLRSVISRTDNQLTVIRNSPSQGTPFTYVGQKERMLPSATKRLRRFYMHCVATGLISRDTDFPILP